jgi:G3E family GTPase
LTPDLFGSPEIGPFGRRQRHPRGHRVAVTIEPTDHAARGDGGVTVLDEFGADDIAPLGSGCACCTVRVKLQARLRRLLAERAQGRVPHFSRIAIRTGEDPGPIRRMFASPRALETEFYLEADPAFTQADGIASFTLTEDAPIAWEAFSRFMATLMRLRGADLLWAQGTLDVQGCRGPVVVRFERHLAHRPVELTEWPNQDRLSAVTFLTRNVEAQTVRVLFDAVRALV